MKADLTDSNFATSALNGWRVEHHVSLGSTSDVARERALAGEDGRLWIVADAQTQGRGRQGRAWRSPPGNLYASALLIDPCATADAAQIGFVAGVAVRRAVADLGVEAQLKWPNDLVVRGAKLAGLLVEGLTLPGSRLAAIVGVGVNVASSPDGLAYPTTSLARELGREHSPAELLARLAVRFDETLAQWNRGAGFAAIRAGWLAGAAGLGRPIRVEDARGAREGQFAGLDERGRLRLERDGTVETVEAADITLISSAPESAARAP